MLPPMAYRVINPSLSGLDAENAYIMVCKQVLPTGLLGLMLTGMYFSTSASANTALNVVSAVFTNDIYKSTINPHADDKKLMFVARASSWFFGVFMILIALIVPYIGGIVEFTLSVGAITGGPLLLPPIWALFSKKLSGKATIYITLISLSVNLLFKIILPLTNDYKLSRAGEMLLGVLLPFFMLLVYEIMMRKKAGVSKDYQDYLAFKEEKKQQALTIDEEEALQIKKQNVFGLKMISFSLLFMSVLLLILAFITAKGNTMVISIAIAVMLGAIIPWRASKRKAMS
jgi:Na+/proline symporter